MIHFISLVGLSYFYFSNCFRIVYTYYTVHSCDVTSEYICFLPSSIYAILAYILHIMHGYYFSLSFNTLVLKAFLGL